MEKQKHFTDRQSAVRFDLDSTVGTGEDKVAPVCAVSEGHWTWKGAAAKQTKQFSMLTPAKVYFL